MSIATWVLLGGLILIAMMLIGTLVESLAPQWRDDLLGAGGFA